MQGWKTRDGKTRDHLTGGRKRETNCYGTPKVQEEQKKTRHLLHNEERTSIDANTVRYCIKIHDAKYETTLYVSRYQTGNVKGKLKRENFCAI